MRKSGKSLVNFQIAFKLFVSKRLLIDLRLKYINRLFFNVTEPLTNVFKTFHSIYYIILL